MVDVDRAVLNANGRSIGETNQGLERSSLRTSNARRALADHPMQCFLALRQKLPAHAAGERIGFALSLLYGLQPARRFVADVRECSSVQVSPGCFHRK